MVAIAERTEMSVFSYSFPVMKRLTVFSWLISDDERRHKILKLLANNEPEALRVLEAALIEEKEVVERRHESQRAALWDSMNDTLVLRYAEQCSASLSEVIEAIGITNKIGKFVRYITKKHQEYDVDKKHP